MKKIIAIILTSFLMAGMAYAKDKVIEKEIVSITQNFDKNGNEYTRLLIKEDKQLNGVKYSIDTPVMAFGKIAGIEGLKTGKNLKAVVSEQEYRGNKSYILRAIIN